MISKSSFLAGQPCFSARCVDNTLILLHNALIFHVHKIELHGNVCHSLLKLLQLELGPPKVFGLAVKLMWSAEGLTGKKLRACKRLQQMWMSCTRHAFRKSGFRISHKTMKRLEANTSSMQIS